jgi:D-arabinose 1-dehydrogenase-like Zn-dependent alcohol dehydrogenase
VSVMRVAQVSTPKGPLEIVERPIPDPPAGEVRIRVEACGVCHSDALVKEGIWPTPYPRVPGHEVVGRIDAVGAGVQRFTIGQRVGVGWHGGHCHHFDNCRRGDFFACQNPRLITGITRDGGYAEYMLALQDALALVPEELSSVEAAPLMCAGITTFNALRHSGALAGDLVAVLGLGGLGHLGVQFAAKMGFRTAAIARGQDKQALAMQLGARYYMGGLGPNGVLMVLGAAESLVVNPGMMIGGKLSVRGWYSGTAMDSQDTLAFSVTGGVRSMNEEFPFEKVAEAYVRMMSGKARFRVVLG